MTSVFRRLARELVIFVFVAGFIGTCAGVVYEFNETKPIPISVTDTPDSVPIPPGAFLETPPPCLGDSGQLQTAAPCFNSADLLEARQKAEREASNKAKRESRLLDVAFMSAVGFGFGGLIGVVLWVLYRGVRFAVTG